MRKGTLLWQSLLDFVSSWFLAGGISQAVSPALRSGLGMNRFQGTHSEVTGNNFPCKYILHCVIATTDEALDPCDAVLLNVGKVTDRKTWTKNK